MNENLDVRMSNYLAILSNPNIQKNFDSNTILAMQEALAIYTATTAVKYVQDYKEKVRQSQEQQQAQEIVNRVLN